MTANAIGYIDPQSVRNMRSGTSAKEFVWPAPDAGLRPIYLNPILSWSHPDSPPVVEQGKYLCVWAAFRVALTGEVKSVPAVYAYELPLLMMPAEAPVNGNRVSWSRFGELRSKEGELTSAWALTGWHVAVPGVDGTESLAHLLADGDELLGWTTMPAWSDDQRLDGVTLLEEICDRARAIISDDNAVGHGLAQQILSVVEAPVVASTGSETTEAEAFARARGAMAFISVYEPDDYARRSVQSMLAWVAVARRQADKALELIDAGLTAQSWQPINMAHKDGRALWVFNGEQGVMKWIEGEGYALWVWVDPVMSDVDPSPEQPTHFRELMAPPTLLR